MHCTSQSLLGWAFRTALRQPATTPPAFLLPFAAVHQTAPFSTTASLSKKRHHRRDNNPERGQSALHRTGLKNQRLSITASQLPTPVLDPAQRSTVSGDPDHGLWGFFMDDREALLPPTALVTHGRAWTAPELRLRDWDDLHRLWWVCVREVNRIKTMEAERKRAKAGHGEYEAEERVKTVRLTMRRIKFVLTERWYAWEDARWAAMSDPSIDMYAEDGQNVYDASKDRSSEDAFETAEAAGQMEAEGGRTAYVPPGSTPPTSASEARV